MDDTRHQAAAHRVAALAAHLASAPRDHTAAARGSTPSTSTSAPTAWHQGQTYNFDPGQLLLGQVALITGAGQGIGRAIAILFAHHGARVVAADVDGAAAAATVDFIRNSVGDVATALAGDVTEPGFAERAVAATLDAYGGLHVLVNNAGFTWDGTVHKMRDAQWQAMLDVHLTAPFRLVRAAAPAMRDAAKAEAAATGRARPRCVLNVSSVSGTHGSAGQTNYAAAKAGVVGFTKALAREWGPFNVRCNALVLGYIATRLVQQKERGAYVEVGGERVALGIPAADEAAAALVRGIALGRVGAPEEAAGAALLVASPYASYITGQAVEVTGGGWL